MPLHFLGDMSVFCPKEATLGGLQDEGWSLERSSRDSRLGIFSPTLCSLEKGERAENGINGPSCLHDEATRKIPMV